MRVELRPTIASDLAAVTHETLPIRIRAITAVRFDDCEQRDRVLGIGGIGYRPDGVVIGFAAIAPEFRRYPVAIHRAGLAMMKIIRESGVPRVIAIADERFGPAERWLQRLGFRMYVERGVKLYVWSAHG
jgi:RimJ/RimL family protein N-acetyltransferase